MSPQAEIQQGGPLPTNDHQAILNKTNKTSKTTRKRTNNDNYNKPQQKKNSFELFSNRLQEDF